MLRSTPAPIAPQLQAASPGLTEPSSVKGAFAPYEVKVDLREFDSVRKFLRSKGISDESTADEVLQWVPAAIVVRMWPERVQNGLGMDFEEGYVAFNIMNCDDGHEYFYASYLIVMNLRGNVTSVKVIDASDKDSYGRMHFDALKLKDPKHFVLGGNTDPYEESGPAYLYNWETQYMLQLADDKAYENSAHDVQWEPRESPQRDGVWRTMSTGFYMSDTGTGETVEEYNQPHIWGDVNHVQILKDGSSHVIVNSRKTDSFSKFDMYSNEILWNVGGEHGTMTLIDLDGNMYSPGENSLHYGQHNLEYFGNEEFMMFE